MLCSSPHTSAQHVPTYNLLQKKSASAQAALELQLHGLLLSTVLLADRHFTSVSLSNDFSAPDAISLTEHNFIVKYLFALPYGWR